MIATYINREWRRVATGISFLTFGLGGLLIPVVVLPIAPLIRPRSRRERFAKRVVHLSFKLFIGFMHRTGVISYDINDLEGFRRPGMLVVANHPTLIDIVFLISLIPNADCIVKSALLRNPFTRGPISVAGYIANDDPDAVVAAAGASLARGNSLIIFPEGTRTRPGEPLKFLRGAANISLRTVNNLTPVIIKCSPITLTKDEKWYQVPHCKPHFSIRLEPDIDITPYRRGAISNNSRQLTKQLQAYFTEEISNSDRA